MDKAPTAGFLKLVQLGVPELTGEHIVVEFADEFPNVVVAAAQLRLAGRKA
jgi:hypothetical protein